MTLHDFTFLLEQGWTPRPPGGERVWQFRLQDTGFPLARIMLKNDGTANGSWSVALTVHGKEKQILSQGLQQLRDRLEKLGNSVTNVDIVEERPR